MAKQMKVAVSMRAVIQRLNRKLHADDEMVRASRGARALQELGEFYVVDTRINGVRCSNVDPEDMARELGVLKAWEAVTPE